MVRIAQPTEHIVKLNMDMVLIICSLLLEKSFRDFQNFFQTWVPYQTPQQISTFIHNLDWTNMHLHEMTWCLQPRKSFVGFLAMCKDRGVKNALCYDATKNILLGNMTEEKLDVLRRIGDEHSTSFVAFNVFNSIYRPETAEDSATSLLRGLKNKHFKAEFKVSVKMLRNRRNLHESCLGWEDYLAVLPPSAPLCSFGITSNQLHFYGSKWRPTYEELLSCTCSKCFIEMLWYFIFRRNE